MARRPTPLTEQPSRSVAERRHAIDRLRRRVEEVLRFEPMSVQARRAPELVKLETAIAETLRSIFGNNTHRYRLYQSAADLEPGQVLNQTASWIAARSAFGGDDLAGPRENLHELRMQILERKQRAIGLREGAVTALEEEFTADDEQPTMPSMSPPTGGVARAMGGPPITDAEIRGRLLTHFHALRHNADGWVPANDIILSPDPVPPHVVGGVCQQLADVGLIDWKPLPGGGAFAGMAKITGKGIAAVEAQRSAEIEIRFPPESTPVAPAASAEQVAHPIAPASEEPLSDAALAEIRDAIAEIRSQLPTIITSNAIKADVDADIVQINTELNRPTPRRKFLKQCLESLRDNVAKMIGGAAAGLAFTLAGILAKHFGL